VRKINELVFLQKRSTKIGILVGFGDF